MNPGSTSKRANVRVMRCQEGMSLEEQTGPCSEVSATHPASTAITIRTSPTTHDQGDRPQNYYLWIAAVKILLQKLNRSQAPHAPSDLVHINQCGCVVHGITYATQEELWEREPSSSASSAINDSAERTNSPITRIIVSPHSPWW